MRARRHGRLLATALVAGSVWGGVAAGATPGPVDLPPAVGDERPVALRVAPGVVVPGGDHVFDGWWTVPAGEVAATRAALGARGVVVHEQSATRRLVTALAGTATRGEPVSPGDPRSDLQWHLPPVEVPAAWATSRGAGVLVAVLDSGVTPGPDLACRAFPGEFDATGGGDAEVGDGAGHGTHVAGTIAQCVGNDLGTAGVAPDVALLDVKVLGGEPTSPDAGTTADVARGLRWAVDNGASVANLSLTSACDETRPTWEEGCRDRLLDEAIAYAVARDVLVVAAAGNVGDGNVGYPATHPDVLAVGALDGSLRRAGYSAVGPALDLVAPGGIGEDTDGDDVVDWVYQEGWDAVVGEHALFGMAGTSMAAPHVSGVAALLRAAAPEASAAQVRAVLLDAACDVGDPGRDDATGVGLVKAANALRVLLGTDDVPSCFRDVPPGATFAADVRALAEAGTTTGCTPTTFCPEDGLTRGQLAALLVRALDLPAGPAGVDTFVDDDGSVFEPAIEAVVAAGITTGCRLDDDGARFCGADPVTRAQSATLLVRALGLVAADEDDDPFVDDDGSPFEDDIEALAASGVTTGCTPDRFCGREVVTRAQSAALLVRGLALRSEDGTPGEG